MVFETWAGEFAVDLDLAGSELKGTIDQVQRVASHRRRQKRAVIAGAVTHDLSRDDDLWEWFVRELEMWI